MASNPVQLAAAGSRAIAVFAESVGASSERLVARIRERGTWGPATVLSTHPQSSVASDYRVGMDRDANALVTWRQGGRVRFAVHEDGSWRAPEIVPQTHQGIAQADMRMGSDGTAILAYAVQSPTGTQD